MMADINVHMHEIRAMAVQAEGSCVISCQVVDCINGVWHWSAYEAAEEAFEKGWRLIGNDIRCPDCLAAIGVVPPAKEEAQHAD